MTLYRLARAVQTLKALASGNPRRIARRDRAYTIAERSRARH